MLAVHLKWFLIYFYVVSKQFMSHQNRSDVRPGMLVRIVLKQDQRTGKLTEGIVQNLLTNSNFHPHGIKVRLADGKVGRVKEILAKSNEPS